jgi:hypothetical protein
MRYRASDAAATGRAGHESPILDIGLGTGGLIWKDRTEILYFQLGRWVLGRAGFPALTLVTPPVLISGDVSPPMPEAFSAGCEVVACPALPIIGDLPTLKIDRGAIRYIARRDHQYYIELKGSFEQYLKGWSQQSRYKLRLHVRRFAKFSGGSIDFREYRSAAEISEFFDLAIPVSRRSRHYSKGIGLRESSNGDPALLVDAAAGNLRGYLLMHAGQAISYVLCRIWEDVIMYSVVGYDSAFAEHRPGTVLLYLILERLFSERQFRIFDFTGTAYPYKEQFSTGRILCARVLWFRPCFRNLTLILANCLVMAVWRSASKLRSGMNAFKSGISGRTREAERWARAIVSRVGARRRKNSLPETSEPLT